MMRRRLRAAWRAFRQPEPVVIIELDVEAVIKAIKRRRGGPQS